MDKRKKDQQFQSRVLLVIVSFSLSLSLALSLSLFFLILGFLKLQHTTPPKKRDNLFSASQQCPTSFLTLACSRSSSSSSSSSSFPSLD